MIIMFIGLVYMMITLHRLSVYDYNVHRLSVYDYNAIIDCSKL